MTEAVCTSEMSV